MLRVCTAELRKSILLFFATRSQPVMLVLVPLIVVFFASFAIQGLITSSSRYRLPVIDLDHTDASSSIIRALEGDGQLDLEVQTRPTFTADEAASALGGGKRIAVLVIPQGTGEAIASGRNTSFPMYVDPSQDTRYGLMFLAVERALYRYAAPAAALEIISSAADVPAATIQRAVGQELQTILSKPIVDVNTEAATRGKSLPNAYDQTVPGIALMWAIGVFSFAVFMIDDERRLFRTWPRALTTPASRFGLLLGRFLASYFYVAVVITFLFTVGAVAFGMDMGDPAALTLVLAIYAAVPAALGTLLAIAGIDRQLAFALGSIGMFVIGALSGALVPLYVLPGWIEQLALGSPLYWAKQAAQDVMIRGGDVNDVVVPVLALSAIAVSCIAAGSLQIRTARK